MLGCPTANALWLVERNSTYGIGLPTAQACSQNKPTGWFLVKLCTDQPSGRRGGASVGPSCLDGVVGRVIGNKSRWSWAAERHNRREAK